MAPALGWTRQFHKAAPGASPLLIFPHAGSGASAYRGFSKVASEQFEVVAFQYPGRQDRAKEPAATTLNALAAGAFEDYRTNATAPLTLFGHSMGAIVAFEFARLAEANGVAVRSLTVSASVPADKIADLPPHPQGEEALLQHMIALEGTGGDVLASREIMKLALPVMRSDYAAFDAYACEPGATISVPINAIGGIDDPFVKPRDLYGWERHTTGGVEVTVFDGAHFYLHEAAQGIVDLLSPVPTR